MFVQSYEPAKLGGLRGRIRDAAIAIATVPAYSALILLLIASALLQPKVFTLPFLLIVLRQSAPLGLLALGQRFVIIGRSLDMSLGGQIALVNVLLASRFFASGPAWPGILMSIGVGLAVGALNGFLVARLRASAVIVTLGTSIVLVGASLVISKGAPGGDINDTVRWLALGRVMGPVPLAALIWFAVALVLAVWVKRTVFQRVLEALGSNYRGARLSGLPVVSGLIVAHMLAGLMAGLAGLLLTGYIGTGTLNLGAELVLASVAAVILGGTTFGGGRGGIAGCIAGVIVLGFLGNLLTSLGIPEPFKLVAQGLVVISAAALAARRS